MEKMEKTPYRVLYFTILSSFIGGKLLEGRTITNLTNNRTDETQQAGVVLVGDLDLSIISLHDTSIMQITEPLFPVCAPLVIP